LGYILGDCFCQTHPVTLIRYLFEAGLPDFSWYNKPKREKYTKRPKKTNGRKIYQLAV
jgi:hypothetical protein